MKLTNREKILLLTLGIIIFIFTYYSLIIKPQINKIKSLKDIANNYVNSMKTTEIDISPNNKTRTEYKILNNKVALLTQNLLPSLNQEKLIIFLDEAIKKSDISVYSISFSEPEIGNIEENNTENLTKEYTLQYLIEEYYGIDFKEKQSSNNEAEDNNGIRLEKMNANILFQGTYNSIIKLIREIENYDKRILIKNLNIVSEMKSRLSGNIILEFYAIPKIHEHDKEFLTWNIHRQYGKNNPFSNAMLADNSSLLKTSRTVEYDFRMIIRPSSSDLPTIVLGKTNDNNQTTYVYGDKNGIEDINIHFYKENNKYYYKYKTTMDSYPNDYNKGEIFEPLGNEILIEILSHKRNSSSDLSGAKIIINNDTDKKVYVNITEDDKDNPRVTIINNNSNVIINRE